MNAGDQLGPYQIIEPIGAGGMGEVFRARDSKLNRDVALKILPPEFAADAQRMGRFEREAQLLASLNHANIAAIHGIEEEGGTIALVLELIEGQTLAERIDRGKLPAEEALRIAVQIAEALECAHDAGIIHRDLKPANVKITPEGRVKVLDFGLAKAMGADDDRTGDGAVSPTLSPTLSLAATQAGMVLGTAGYMSPEQARGKPADRRADIWGLGVITCEMLVGRPMFTADTIADTLARVLTQEPDWNRVADVSPEPLMRILRRCLNKDADQRYRDIGDVRMEMQELLDEGLEGRAMAGAAGATPPAMRGWQLAAAVMAVAAIAGWAAVLLRSGDASEGGGAVSRLEFELSAGEMIATDMDVRLFDISADGSAIAWVSQKAPRQVYVRSIDSHDVRALPDTEGAINSSVEFNPEGSEVAFVKNGDLWAVPLDGGLGREWLAGGSNSEIWDFDWADDGSMFVSLANRGIFRLEAPGGNPSLVFSYPDGDIEWAATVRALPGVPAILFGGYDLEQERDLYVLRLDDPDAKPRLLLEGFAFAEYSPTGHLVSWADGAIYAVEFDLATLQARGTPRAVVSQVQRDLRSRVGEFAFAGNGTLVHIPEQGLQDWRLAWVSNAASAAFLDGEAGPYEWPRISPSGSRVSVSLDDVSRGPRIVVGDAAGDLDPLTSASLGGWAHAWGPNDAEITFDDRVAMYRQATTRGSAAEELFVFEEIWPTPLPERSAVLITDRSVDGRQYLAVERTAGDSFRFFVIDAETGEVTPITPEGASEQQPRFSPNGRWVTYVSDEEGEPRVYAREITFDEAATPRVVEITSGVGWYPAWSRDGDEIFWVDATGQTIWARSFTESPVLDVGAARQVFHTADVELPEPGWILRPPTFDVGPRDRVFLVAREPVVTMSVYVTLNWFEDLASLVPVAR